LGVPQFYAYERTTSRYFLPHPVGVPRADKADGRAAALNARLKQLGKGIMNQALLPGVQRS
jgi:hypothetical protein